jgi:hypothetical protein
MSHILHIFSWPEKKYQFFCPPPVPKTKTDENASSPGAMTGDDYSLILHCTVGHLRGALPDFADCEKAVNFFAPPPTPKYIFYIFYIFDIFDILFLGIQFVRHNQSLDFGIMS